MCLKKYSFVTEFKNFVKSPLTIAYTGRGKHFPYTCMFRNEVAMYAVSVVLAC